MPNGDLGTVEQTLKVNLKGTDVAREQLNEVNNSFEEMVGLFGESVNLQATKEFESLKDTIQEVNEDLLELELDFTNFDTSPFTTLGQSFEDFVSDFEDAKSTLQDVMAQPNGTPVPLVSQTEEWAFNMDDGLDLSDDSFTELTDAVISLEETVTKIQPSTDFSTTETGFNSNFDTQFHNPFEEVEEAFLELDPSVFEVQNSSNIDSPTITYDLTPNTVQDTLSNLVDDFGEGIDLFSDAVIQNMEDAFSNLADVNIQRNSDLSNEYTNEYANKLSSVPEESSFSSNDSYYADLEKRYNRLQTMINQLEGSDTGLVMQMTDTQSQLEQRMSSVKETQAQQLQEANQERELLRQQAEERKAQQRTTQQQELLMAKQQQQTERQAQQNLLQEQGQRQEEERQQERQRREQDKVHYQSLLEDKRKTQDIEAQSSATLNDMQSTLNTSVINFNQAVQLVNSLQRSVSKVTDFYDDYTNSNARLNFSNLGDMPNTDYQRLVSQSASEARMSYADVANNIARFSMTKGFDSNEEAITFAETIAKSMRLAGSSTQETTSAIRQLTQAVSKGKLDGDEFRSVAESSPLLINALTEVLNTDRAGIMKASASGNLTLDTLKEAVVRMGAEVNDAFKDMPRTFRDLRTEMQNGLGEWLTTTKNGQDFMNELFDIYEEFLGFIESEEGKESFKETASFFKNMTQVVGEFIHIATPLIGFVGEHATLVGSMYLAYKGVNLAMKLNLINTTGELISNFTSMGGAMSSLSTLAVSFLSNPYVLAIAGIGALAYGAVKLYEGVDDYKTSDLAGNFNGRDYETLIAQGYNDDEAKQLQELYAQRNMAYNDLLYYDTGAKYQLSNTHTVKSQYLEDASDYQSRKDDYEKYIDQINDASYLDQLVSTVGDIADSSATTAENTGDSKFVKALQLELSQAQQVKTVTQVAPQIVINVDAKSDSEVALGEKLALILKQELQVATTS